MKDLPFFEKLAMTRGANIKITILLNQASMTVTSTAGGVFSVDSHSLKGQTIPLKRIADAADDDYTETMSVAVVQNGAYSHEKKQCRLYCPVYTLNPEMEKSYLSLGKKKIVYEDVLTVHLRDLGTGNFQNLLTNSLARMQRLVIVPMLSRGANGALGLVPQQSPYASEPSTCSPCFIRNFNVQLSALTSIHKIKNMDMKAF